MTGAERFAKRAGIMLHSVTPIPTREDWDGDEKASHYLVSLGFYSEHRILTVTFSKGSAHRVWKRRPGIWPDWHPFHGKRPGDRTGAFHPRTVAELETWKTCTVPDPPSLSEVLYCLALDVRIFEHGDADDVLSDLPASRAIRAYDAMREYSEVFRFSLTDEDWDAFLALDEDEEDEEGEDES